jgi:hypothetical protein
MLSFRASDVDISALLCSLEIALSNALFPSSVRMSFASVPKTTSMLKSRHNHINTTIMCYKFIIKLDQRHGEDLHFNSIKI